MRVDAIEVSRVLTPGSSEEIAEMLDEVRGPVAPVGNRSQLSFGNPLEPVDAALDMTHLDRVTEYVPADLTIHLEAGIRLGHLEQILSTENQMLALDPWSGPDATIGGIVATNAQGPFRAVGTIRDWIIGMRVVRADGTPSRTGGRVVKNVSGYDLAKLYTGSLGSLGIITEVSLKLRARYDATASARVCLPDARSAAAMIAALRSGPLDPVSLVWTGPSNQVRVRFGEHRNAVRWQLRQLPPGDWETFEGDAERELWDDVCKYWKELPSPMVRVVALPGQVAGLIDRFEPDGWLAHAANGIVFMTLGAERVGELRQEFPVILERAPREVRRAIPTFGLRGDEYEIMRNLKRALDPDRRLNPGRHVDGEHPQ